MKPVSRRVETRLATLFRAPGGLVAEVAEERATAAVERQKDGLRTALAEAVAALDRAVADRRGADVYSLANQLIDIGGQFSPALARAGFSLCDLAADQDLGAASPAWTSVQVHLDAIRLISVGELPDGAADKLVAALSQLSRPRPD